MLLLRFVLLCNLFKVNFTFVNKYSSKTLILCLHIHSLIWVYVAYLYNYSLIVVGHLAFLYCKQYWEEHKSYTLEHTLDYFHRISSWKWKGYYSAVATPSKSESSPILWTLTLALALIAIFCTGAWLLPRSWTHPFPFLFFFHWPTRKGINKLNGGSHEGYDTIRWNSLKLKDTLSNSKGNFALNPKISTAGMDVSTLKLTIKVSSFTSAPFSLVQNKMRFWTSSLTFTSQNVWLPLYLISTRPQPSSTLVSWLNSYLWSISDTLTMISFLSTINEWLT